MTVAEALDLAARWHRDGRWADAESVYRRILAEHPDTATAHNLLGVLRHQQGEHADAIAHLRRAIAIEPTRSDFFVNLSAPLNARGDTAGAIAACRQALALDPTLPDAWYNLGLWLAVDARTGDAEQALREALRLRPDRAEWHNGLGNLLTAEHRAEEAIAAYREAIRLRGDYAEAHYNIANVLAARGDDAAALQHYRTALALKPDFADAHFNFGNFWHRRGELDAAAACFDAALRAEPKYVSALWHLGNVGKDRGRIAEAIACWRRALTMDPGDAALHSTLALYLRFDPATTPAQVAAEESAWNERHAVPLRPLRPIHARSREPEKQLRVGFISPDFWDHAVGRNVRPLLAAHDRERFEFFCYSDSLQPDALTDRLRSDAGHWCESGRLSHEALAARIRADEVDVLVDLALHTGGNRLLVFARQPAPVQMSFAGYPGGTGVETIPHRISDPHLEGGSAISTTTHLLESFWCFDPVELDIAVNPLPALDAGHVTFGCLNHACKTNAPVLALWARVLRECPGSRLLLLSPPGRHRTGVLEALRAHGIADERVMFAPHRPRAEYMRLYHHVDLGLDTFPYGGHTTSLEALWMGVPVVTLPGEAIVSRAGLSQLRNLGHADLVARDADDFVRIAITLATDLPRLATLRATLRAEMERSVLMDAPRFARGVEKAFRTAWRQWCLA